MESCVPGIRKYKKCKNILNGRAPPFGRRFTGACLIFVRPSVRHERETSIHSFALMCTTNEKHPYHARVGITYGLQYQMQLVQIQRGIWLLHCRYLRKGHGLLDAQSAQWKPSAKKWDTNLYVGGGRGLAWHTIQYCGPPLFHGWVTYPPHPTPLTPSEILFFLKGNACFYRAVLLHFSRRFGFRQLKHENHE